MLNVPIYRAKMKALEILQKEYRLDKAIEELKHLSSNSLQLTCDVAATTKN